MICKLLASFVVRTLAAAMEVGMGKTLSDKVWENHVVRTAPGEPDLLYIDLHLVHEVTSPQAFDGLRLAGRGVRRTDLTMATEDHNTPTLNILSPIADPVSKLQVDTLRKNAADSVSYTHLDVYKRQPLS